MGPCGSVGVWVSLMVLGNLLGGLWAVDILNACHAQCQFEVKLKQTCKRERGCDSKLPDFEAFLQCIEPCSRIGNNCFQRCAFKTDEISQTCQRRCRLTQDTEEPLMAVDVRRNDVSANGEGIQETVCYRSCYDNLLNIAMNRLYKKRPILE